MEKKIISILAISILIIVIFINFNSDSEKTIHIWNLMYYSQYYVIVGVFIWFLWVLFSNKIIRILTIPIVVYYSFHLIVNFIEIFSPELKEILYTTKIINYLLSISMAISILIAMYWKKATKLIISLYDKAKRFIDQKIRK